MGSNKNWTEEDKLYLSDNWGSLSLKTLSTNLNRSEDAIKVMKVRLGLGRFLESGDYISYSQLLQALYGLETASIAYRNPKKGKDFPIRKKRVGKCTFRVVYLDDFWEWAEENKRLLDFTKLEENLLGAEPNWVKRKRKVDFECQVNTKPWTKAEDMKLHKMLGTYRYTYTDLSDELNRSEGAVKRRILDLGYRERPIKNENRDWGDDEVQLLVFMYQEGYSFEKIGFKLGRSALGCRGKMERIESPGYFNRENRRKREALKSG